MRDPARQRSPAVVLGLGSGGSQAGAVIAIVFGVVIAMMSWFLLGRAGLSTVMTLLSLVVAGAVLSYVAWHNIAVLVVLWLFTMSGFRAYAMIHMPILPDLSVERVLALWVIIMFSVRLLMKKDRVRGPFVVDVLLLLHVAYILANTMYIGSRAHTHEWALSSLTPFVGYLMGKNIMYREREVRFLFLFFAIVMVYYAVQSVAQKYSLDFLVWPKAITNLKAGLHHIGRSRGPFLHPPLFGQIMAMLIPVQFYLFFRFKARVFRGAILFVLALSCLGIFYTYTRAPWVAMIAAFATLAIMRPRYRQLIVGVGVVVAVAGFFGVARMVESDSQFFQERVTNVWTIKNRLAAISAALRMWRDNPLFGIGFFNWDHVYGLYIRGEEIPFFGYVERHAGMGVRIHDIYFGRLAEEGIMSLALLASVVMAVWLRFRNLWRTVNEADVLNRDGLAVVAAMLIAYLVGGLGIDFRYFDLVNAIPYMLVGILYGYEVPYRPPPPSPYRLWTPPYFARRDRAGPT